MSWHRLGTVSVTQNSSVVTGVNTAFAANTRIGDAFIGPDGRQYELGNVASDTVISIIPPYLGSTASGASYAIAPIQGYQKGLADQVRDWVNTYGPKMAALGTTGNYEVLPPSKGGTGITDLSAFIQGLLNDVDAPAARATLVAAKSGVNADITELSSLTKPLTLQQGGVAESYIEGLLPVWYSANSIGIDSGAAYVPGAGKALKVPSPIVKTGLAPATNTWYYIYLFDNFGTPDINFSTTPPASPYLGAARTKAGDSSMRFIAALRVGAAGFRPFLCSNGAVIYTEDASSTLALSGGTATTSTSVNCSSFIPPTTQRCILMLYAAPSGGTLIVGYANTIEILSCPAGNRYQAETLCSSVQTINYRNNAAVTVGSSIGVRGYGLER